jgi:predicted acylesterase/phospholipase RssA
VIARVDHHLKPELASVGVRFEGELPAMPGVAQLLRRPTLGSTTASLAMLVQRRFTAMLINAVKPGTFDLADRLRFLHDVDWPSLDLRVGAASAHTGARQVFTPSSGTSLIDAVAASCAIPGVMRSMMVDGVPYVDGGLISPTNADVLDDLTGELVVVLSPMSGACSSSTIGRLSSTYARRRLAFELKRLRRKHQVLLIEPANTLATMVLDAALATDNNRHILAATFLGSSQSI